MKAVKIFAALLAAGILLAGCGTAEKSGHGPGESGNRVQGLQWAGSSFFIRRIPVLKNETNQRIKQCKQ